MDDGVITKILLKTRGGEFDLDSIHSMCLRELEGLQALESLQHLNLAGNLIGSVESLRCLTGLDKLKTLRLQDKTQDLSNPVCLGKNYRADMLSLFPNLEWLDGEKLIGRGSEVFQLCRKIEEALDARTSEEMSQVSKPEKWVQSDYWEPSNKFEKESILSDASEELKALLMSCKYSVHKSEETLSQLKNTSSSTS